MISIPGYLLNKKYFEKKYQKYLVFQIKEVILQYQFIS